MVGRKYRRLFISLTMALLCYRMIHWLSRPSVRCGRTVVSRSLSVRAETALTNRLLQGNRGDGSVLDGLVGDVGGVFPLLWVLE